jgi:hypothetical protein
MRAILSALVGVALASCDSSAADNSIEGSRTPLEPPKTPIMIRTMAGEPEEQAFLVEPSRNVPFDQLADGVRETGNRCEAVTAFDQLEDNGKRMDIYKLDCGKRSYQVTVLEGSTHIKRWTGNIFGQ